MSENIIIGTAGHVDHGKTTLINSSTLQIKKLTKTGSGYTINEIARMEGEG